MVLSTLGIVLGIGMILCGISEKLVVLDIIGLVVYFPSVMFAMFEEDKLKKRISDLENEIKEIKNV